MKVFLFISSILFSFNAISSQENWVPLISEGKVEEAEVLCQKLALSQNKIEKASAYKCFANLTLMGKDILILEGNEVGGGIIKEGWKGEPLEKALAFLDAAIALTPKDESIHQGRMHLLLQSGMYEKAHEALLSSLQVLNQSHHLELWLNYTPYYFDSGQFSYCANFTKTLLDVFGEDHRLYANLGASYSMLQKDDEAIINLQKAVDLNPSSPLNTWNLARLYDFTNKLKLADSNYEKALSLKAGEYDTDLQPEATCLYSEFLFKKLENTPKACKFNKSQCNVTGLVCE